MDYADFNFFGSGLSGLGKLHERNGEHKYLHTVLIETVADADPTLELVNLAREFYPGSAEAQDDGSYFFCGGIFVSPATLVEVTEDEYAVLKRYC